MEKLLGYKPFHFLLFLVLGISFQFYTNCWNYGIVITLYIFLFFVLICFFMKKSKFFGLFIGLTFFLVGVFIVHNGDVTKAENFFVKHITDQSSAVLKIKSILKPGNYHQKYIAEVIQIDHKITRGKVLLKVVNDSLKVNLNINDKILLRNNFLPVNKALNPHQFDYKKYLEDKGVHQQIETSKEEILFLDVESSFPLGIIHKIRVKLQKSLKLYPFSKDELSVINALLLGQRQDISTALTANYSKAGAIHILAISGLHVGIILWLLSLMFNPIESFKKGKEIKLFLMILFLWIFALLAGMSASVTRSVTMFSAVAVGYFFNKKNAIEHSLIFSMFILLLVKPLFLFDVGFQLSYLAVFGIIWIQPLLYRLWTPKFNILDKGWQLFTVSLAAQIGVFPLSLFYFHQFPGLFFVSNLMIVPFLGLILGTGIIILTLAYFSILPDFIVTVYASVISTLNQLVALIAKQETFLFSDISFSAIKMVLSYVTILVGFQFLINRNVKRCLLFLSMVLIFQSFSFYEKYETQRTNQFIVFHKSRNSIVGNRVGAHLKIYHNMDTLIHNQNLLKNYTIGENIQHVNYDELPSLLQVNSQIILCVDANGNYDIQDLKKPIVLLQQSPKINLERLIKRLNPSIIIADGSNYKSDVNLWKTSCLKLGISFWSTREKGAYVYEYKNQLF